jgi:hypothetical protein
MRRFLLVAAIFPPLFACGGALAINISPSESPYAILEPQTVATPAPPVVAEESGDAAPRSAKRPRPTRVRSKHKTR